MFNKSARKVLVVDDDDTVRSLCEEVLSVAGYQVDTAAHGHAGLEKIKRSRYDMVVSDVNMPELDGMDFYRQALEREPALREKFLFVTGDLSRERKECFAGMKVKCLAKPFRITEFLGCVDTIMAGSLKAAGKETGKRQEGRYALKAGCDIFEESEPGQRSLAAVTENVSRNGLKVRYEGEPILPSTTVSVYLSINGLSMHRAARVTWSMPVDGRSSASGVHLDEPLPVSSIVNVTPASPL